MNPLAGTPLDQTLFRFERTPVMGKPTYCPPVISLMEQGHSTEVLAREAESVIHEICHALQIFMFGDRARLLEPNFGFKRDQFGIAGFKTEAWVYALQHLMALDALGASREAYRHPVLPDVMGDLWKATVENWQWVWACEQAMKVHIERGMQFYYAKWQETVAWIAENSTNWTIQ